MPVICPAFFFIDTSHHTVNQFPANSNFKRHTFEVLSVQSKLCKIFSNEREKKPPETVHSSDITVI